MAMDLSKSKNANKMRDIQKKSREQSNGIITINVPLDQIDENPDNEKTFNMEKVDSIARSIEQVGWFGSISVFKKPDGRYEISSGHTRFRAMKKTGAETIPCSVSPYPDEFKRGLMLLSSNINNRVMLPLDWAKSIDYYYELMKKAKKDFGKGDQSYTGRLRDNAAEFFDMSPVNIHRYHSLLNLIPQLQEMANDPEYPYSAFVSAASMTNEEQELLYSTICEEVENNKKRADSIPTLSRARIEQIINGIKQKPDEAQKNKEYSGFVTNAFEGGNPDTVKEETSRDVTDQMDAPEEFLTERKDPLMEERSDIDDGEDGEEYAREDYEPQESASTYAPTIPNSSSAEVKLSAFTPEIEKIASGQYEVSDPEMVRRYLKRLKAAIEQIEKNI